MYCPNCGKKMPDEARFCFVCGANLSELNEAPERPDEPVTISKGDIGLDRSQTVFVQVGKVKEGEKVTGHHCAICGVFLMPGDRFFRCRECGRDHLCLHHRHERSYVCEECAAEAPPGMLEKIPSGEAAGQDSAARLDDVDPYGEMILIAAGGFLMGSREDDLDAYDEDVMALRDVYVDGFYVAKYPVTNARYKAFMEAGGYCNMEYWSSEGWKCREDMGYSNPRYWDDYDFNDHSQPVVGVSYYEAEAYCRWAGMRLPTEAEWEKAARGIDGRTYPWGDEWQEGRCNSDAANVGHTTPVDRYSGGASPYGAMDMAGNTWEWTSTWHNAEREDKVIRGGSWGYHQTDVRCATRERLPPWERSNHVGFRCVGSSR
jgi:formylglycine-generating enzyme required for sulfatase activity